MGNPTADATDRMRRETIMGTVSVPVSAPPRTIAAMGPSRSRTRRLKSDRPRVAHVPVPHRLTPPTYAGSRGVGRPTYDASASWTAVGIRGVLLILVASPRVIALGHRIEDASIERRDPSQRRRPSDAPLA